MSNHDSIKSVADFVQTISELKLDSGKTRFFRGHASCDYKLIPSIYRPDCPLIEHEHKIIQDMLTECSEYFLPHETLFEKLVRLQHYKCATRLLDITYNALVALYFAVNSNNDKDGEVIIFDIPNHEIKYPDSDTVAILSAVAIQDYTFKIDELTLLSQYNMERKNT